LGVKLRPLGWTRLVGVACLALALPAGAWAAPRAGRGRGPNGRTGRATPPLSALVRAARKNDRATLERLAARLGVARLGEGVASPDASVAQAALAAVPLARGGVLLAGVVAGRLDTGDPTLGAAAARTLGVLLAADAATELADWEVPPDVVARACGGLRALASLASAPPAPRLAALDALGFARGTCPGDEPFVALMRDPSPAVRRAAALLLRPADAAAAAALRAGLADPEPAVAAACAARVCAGSPATALRRKGDALSDAAEAAARTLAVAPATAPEDAVEMLACLVAAGTAADRAALETLRVGPPSPVRDAAALLVGFSAPPKTE
jgi:hypothetical protein